MNVPPLSAIVAEPEPSRAAVSSAMVTGIAVASGGVALGTVASGGVALGTVASGGVALGTVASAAAVAPGTVLASGAAAPGAALAPPLVPADVAPPMLATFLPSEAVPVAGDLLVRAAMAVAHWGCTAADFAALPDTAIRSVQETITVLQREVDQVKAWVAGTIAERFRHELGNNGLAQREGFRTPEAFIQSITGITRAEATKFVRVGTMMADATALEELEKVDPIAAAVVAVVPKTGFATDASWQRELAAEVAARVLGVDAAEAIRNGLGSADAVVTGDMLRDAATGLIREAGFCTPDALGRLARQLREALDVDAVSRREKSQQDLEFLRMRRCKDGMVRGEFALTAENGELLLQVTDTGTSPRRGGPRFVDEADQARAKKIVDDPRSNDQLNAATLVAVLQLATQADPTRMLGSRLPAVRVIVPQGALTAGVGFGRLQESGGAVSLDAVERMICNTGTVTVTIDEAGQTVDVGREQRLFTARQRIGFAVRDGGCMDPDCDRPPSWTEAHHIRFWERDDGPTDLANGLSLCKSDHLRYHNNGWEIELVDGLYWLIPPTEVDSGQTPRPMWSKNPVIRAKQTRTPEQLAADRHCAAWLAADHRAARVAKAAAAVAAKVAEAAPGTPDRSE